MKRFRNTPFFRFYSTAGVPHAFSDFIQGLKEEKKL